jgi:hypothetical protein
LAFLLRSIDGKRNLHLVFQVPSPSTAQQQSWWHLIMVALEIIKTFEDVEAHSVSIGDGILMISP